jgi:hypothetical protein
MRQPEAQVQSKLDALRATVDPVTPLFVLIDPMVGEPMPGIGSPAPGSDPTEHRAGSWQREVVPVVLSKSIALPAHQHPYLIQLRGTEDPLLELTFELAAGEQEAAQAGGLDGNGRAAHRIGGWLQSSMRGSELGELISRMCRVNTEAATTATYLRLADRRVLDLLRHVVGDERVAGQLGRVQRWSYLNASGDLCQLRSPSEHSELVCISEAEWRRMERGEMLHRIIAHYLGEPVLREAAIVPPTYLAAETALVRSKDAARRWPHRFDGDIDSAVWAALTLWRPSMSDVAAVKKLLDHPGSTEEPAETVSYLHREIVALTQNAGL